MLVETDAFMAHHGVKGQKWGRRNSRSKTGITRRQAALINKNQRTAEGIAKQLNEIDRLKSHGIQFINEDKQHAIWQQKLKKIVAQNDRIRSGKASVSDNKEANRNINVLDIMRSRKK